MSQRTWISNNRPIVAVRDDGSMAGWFESIARACRYLRVAKQSMKRALATRNATCKGFRWMFKKDYDEVFFTRGTESLAIEHRAAYKKHHKHPVRCITDGNEFDSIKEAANHYGLSESGLRAAIHKGTRIHKMKFNKLDRPARAEKRPTK